MKKISVCIGIVMYFSLALGNFAGAAELPPEEKVTSETTKTVTQVTPADKKKCKMYLGVEIRSWFPKMSGQETRNSQLDLQNDLGHGNKELTAINLTLIENSKINGSYESYNFTGNKTALGQKSFGGQNYLAGDGLHSEKKLMYWKIDYLPNYQKAVDSNFSWLVGIHGYKVNSSVEASGVANRKTEQSYNAVVPTFGAHYELGGNRPTTYYVELSGSPHTGNGYNYDAELGFQHKLSPNIVFGGGYRWLTIQGEKDNDQLKLQLRGPFMQLNCKL